MADYNRDERKDDRKSRDGGRGPYKGGDRRSGGYDRSGPRGGGYRPRRDGDRPRRDGDRPRYGGDRDGGDRGHGDYRGRRDGGRPRRDGEGRSEDRPRYGGDRPRYGGDRDFHRGGDRPRYGGSRGGYGRDYAPRDRTEDEPVREEPVEQVSEQKLTIPSDPQKMLFKGIDCQVNGRDDLALILFLHGAVAMSKGCENNAITIMRGMDATQLAETRASIADRCSAEAMVEFDYICLTMRADSERRFLEGMYADGNQHAIYCKIRLEEVPGDDPVIDTFASRYDEDQVRVTDGLIFLKRRIGSEKAEECIKNNENRKNLKMSIRGVFVKAMRGDASALNRLDELAAMFPDAAFLKGYIEARDAGEGVEYLKNRYSENGKLIVSMSADLGIGEDPFGMFLRAKRLQADKEEWIRFMIDAAKAGSDEALDDLKPVQNRADVRKAFSSIYLARGDAENLVRLYDGEDSYHLDQYCAGDPDRIEAVGKLMNGEKEIDWLKKNYRDGVEECRDALVAMASDETRHSKRLVYALHDVGADMDAAKLWFAMGDDPTLPSFKWLGKVCESEDVKAYVREQFEARGDLETFDAIFVDDGYSNRGSGKGRGRSGGPRGGRRY